MKAIATDIFAYLLLALYIATGLYIYFLPSLVAYRRYGPNANTITLLNAVLGWTVQSSVWSTIVVHTQCPGRIAGPI